MQSETMLKKYKFGFEPWGLFLFIIIMIPNFFWFIFPPRDTLYHHYGNLLPVIYYRLDILLLRYNRKKYYFSSDPRPLSGIFIFRH